MKTRVALVLAAVGGIGAAANAQVDFQSGGQPVALNYTLSFTEINAATLAPVGSPNGVIDPGEGALINLALDLTPNVGAAITYPSSLGGSGTGTLRGIGSIFVDLVGTATATGTWNFQGNGNTNGAGQTVQSWGSFRQWINTDPSDPTNPDSWILRNWDDLGIGNGTPDNGGSRLRNVQVYQVATSAAGILTTDPLANAWRGLWIPSSYAARTETFSLANGTANPGPSSIGLGRDSNTANTAAIAGSIQSNFGAALNIPIVPAPSSLALLGLGGLVAARRRR